MDVKFIPAKKYAGIFKGTTPSGHSIEAPRADSHHFLFVVYDGTLIIGDVDDEAEMMLLAKAGSPEEAQHQFKRKKIGGKEYSSIARFLDARWRLYEDLAKPRGKRQISAGGKATRDGQVVTWSMSMPLVVTPAEKREELQQLIKDVITHPTKYG